MSKVAILPKAEWLKAYKAGLAPKEVVYRGKLVFDYYASYLTEEEQEYARLKYNGRIKFTKETNKVNIAQIKLSPRFEGKLNTKPNTASVNQRIAIHHSLRKLIDVDVDTRNWKLSADYAGRALTGMKSKSVTLARNTAKQLVSEFTTKRGKQGKGKAS
jgi:hypothetical protein